MKTGTTALGTALTDSANSFTAMEADVDSLFGNAGTQAGNTANALRNQATNISKQAQSYQNIYDALDELSNNNLMPEVAKIAIDHLKTNVGATITQLNDLANSLNTSADNIDTKVSDTTADRERVNQLAQQAKASGVPPLTSAPRLDSRALTSLDWSAALRSALILATTLGGVPAGTMKPPQERAS